MPQRSTPVWPGNSASCAEAFCRPPILIPGLGYYGLADFDSGLTECPAEFATRLWSFVVPVAEALPARCECDRLGPSLIRKLLLLVLWVDLLLFVLANKAGQCSSAWNQVQLSLHVNELRFCMKHCQSWRHNECPGGMAELLETWRQLLGEYRSSFGENSSLSE